MPAKAPRPAEPPNPSPAAAPAAAPPPPHDSDEWDLQRLTYDELRRGSRSLLSRLSKVLYSGPKGNVPRFLAYHLDANWRELTADASFDPREWQTGPCRDAARARQAEEERRRRDQASNASGESATATAEAEATAGEPKKSKRKSNGDAEEAETAKKGPDLLPPGIPGLSSRRNSRSSSVQSVHRPNTVSARAPPANSARPGLGTRSSVTGRRGSALLRVPGTNRSLGGSATAMDEIASERTSLGGTSKMCE